MADDEAAPMTLKERMAKLNLQQVGGSSPAPQPQTRPKPPPPPRPQLPARPDRPNSTNVPPTQDHPSAANRVIGNLPQGAPNGSNGARPALPARTSTQSSQASTGPALPPRRPSGQPSPALPPRRPSEAPSCTDFDRSRRGSTDSMSSVATTRSSVSGISNATSLTSQGERFKIRAPEFDASKLPPLPPKRTQEQKEAADRRYAGLRPLRQTKSTPKVDQFGKNGTTPPPVARQSTIQPPPPRCDVQDAMWNGRLAIEPAPRPAIEPPPRQRPQPPPPPVRAEPTLPPRPKRSALEWGMNKATNTPPSLPDVRPDLSNEHDAPPPVPASSKPDLKALQASKPKINGAANGSSVPSSTAGPVEIVSAQQFNHTLSSSRVVVADFWAPWCGPCRNFAPEYEQMSRQLSKPGQVTFIKINTDENKDLLQHYQIQAWPTILIFDSSRQVEKFEGANKYGIEAKLDELAHAAPSQSHSAPTGSVPAPYAASNSCLHCRDFSGPDHHAARFPRQSIPSTDIGWLAQQLTSPFPSHTDKARAIFTWLHHNVDYDTVAFFGNNVKPSTPQSTLQSGLAVCEGYAGLFSALALKAGLEAIVISGHGKGFGHSALKPGDPLPPYNAGHAWNAVKIDNGEWKLIDCCWGAGHLGASQTYERSFSPDRFTQTNNEFGLDHFPGDSSKQFRTDGRVVTWEEYILGNKSGCGADFFSGFVAEEGLSKISFQPTSGKIVLAQQGPTIRFAFQKICPHWDPIRCGRGPHFVYVLILDNLEHAGLARNYIPFETNGDVWWCDVPTQDVGSRPGQKVQIMVLQKMDGRDARGISVEEYKRKRGHVGIGPLAGVCKWETA